MIEEHYTDTAGCIGKVFGLTHLLGVHIKNHPLFNTEKALGIALVPFP
jgi:TnpA family transposase